MVYLFLDATKFFSLQESKVTISVIITFSHWRDICCLLSSMYCLTLYYLIYWKFDVKKQQIRTTFLNVFSNPNYHLSDTFLNLFFFTNVLNLQVFLLRNYVIELFFVFWLREKIFHKIFILNRISACNIARKIHNSCSVSTILYNSNCNSTRVNENNCSIINHHTCKFDLQNWVRMFFIFEHRKIFFWEQLYVSTNNSKCFKCGNATINKIFVTNQY